MKYQAVCKRSYTKYKAIYKEKYPIVQVDRYTSYAKLPLGDLSVESREFDRYFEIEEV